MHTHPYEYIHPNKNHIQKKMKSSKKYIFLKSSIEKKIKAMIKIEKDIKMMMTPLLNQKITQYSIKREPMIENQKNTN